MTLFRSLLFTVVFYVVLVLHLIAALPTVVLPSRRPMLGIVKTFGRVTVWLLDAICGLKVEWRGLEKIPHGAVLVAAKHQSAWETFTLVPLFDDPTFVLKAELTKLPLYGPYTRKTGMIPVDRDAGRAALVAVARRAKDAFAESRQVVIFPEGTRRAPGAAPDYKPGIAFLYTEGGVPCLPIALNSGLFWPRRSWLRRPGTIVVEVLDPIPSGLPRKVFMKRLETDIETATARLVAEGRRLLGEPDPAPAAPDSFTPAV
ncbi:1-acyl-sn-glycerol-3-phosphate acyltransferase [Rhodovulum sp. PH10]|uniref:lysophospholipid acyltransferase family protein n=1 Tax=Rhodovulum sp. PH10 TaxID=1187851 RepID=UPI00027C2E41|nr:1-acyl-sn-glycerol-3-phosphate acyltransferase [Rhodovulum sp. PH10]EJW10433.1 1-acyl-sn-glycerol-3-phosphate acyltransferase [Rhodovulum sp. PH10]